MMGITKDDLKKASKEDLWEVMGMCMSIYTLALAEFQERVYEKSKEKSDV